MLTSARYIREGKILYLVWRLQMSKVYGILHIHTFSTCKIHIVLFWSYIVCSKGNSLLHVVINQNTYSFSYPSMAISCSLYIWLTRLFLSMNFLGQTVQWCFLSPAKQVTPQLHGKHMQSRKKTLKDSFLTYK